MFRLHPEDESAAVLLRQNHPAVTNESLAEFLASLGSNSSTPVPGRLLTAREVADRLSCSVRHVYDLMRRGDLPRVKVGCSTRIPESAVIALAEGDR